jgi:MFS family permease
MILLASLGGALELYDFVVFGVFASSIGAAFFPTAHPLVSQMLAYAGFAIGYFARPVGGIVLGHFGDRVGRRNVFVGSMLVVSLVTLAMGLLPTYAQWGAAAPLLLLVLRMVQGFCLGGEIPGAITYAVETVPQRASLVCGVVFACVNAGVLLATLVNLGAQELLPPAALPGWGWRIGFLVGGLRGCWASGSAGHWKRRRHSRRCSAALRGCRCSRSSPRTRGRCWRASPPPRRPPASPGCCSFTCRDI